MSRSKQQNIESLTSLNVVKSPTVILCVANDVRLHSAPSGSIPFIQRWQQCAMWVRKQHLSIFLPFGIDSRFARFAATGINIPFHILLYTDHFSRLRNSARQGTPVTHYNAGIIWRKYENIRKDQCQENVAILYFRSSHRRSYTASLGCRFPKQNSHSGTFPYVLRSNKVESILALRRCAHEAWSCVQCSSSAPNMDRQTDIRIEDLRAPRFPRTTFG